MTNHQATIDGIAHLKAANERNNADMLDYINRMIWERKSDIDKCKALSLEFSESAYHLVKAMTYDKCKEWQNTKVKRESQYQKACIKAKKLGIV